MTPSRPPSINPMETPPTHQSGTMSRVELKIDALHQQMVEIKEYVMGPFGESHKGLDARVRELEQSERSRKRWFGAVMVAAIGTVITTIWNLVVTGKSHP